MKSKSPKSSSSLLSASTALAAVSTSPSDAALVQITLSGNRLDLESNSLSANLTGDNFDDIVISGIGSVSNLPMQGFTFVSTFQIPILSLTTPSGRFSLISSTIFTTLTIPGASGVKASFNNNLANASLFVSSLGAPIGSDSTVPGGLGVGGFSLTFSDPGIFGGASTNTFLEITSDPLNQTIKLTRLAFDDGQGSPATPDSSKVIDQNFSEFSPVPEPSGPALLALGAGGISLRRKRKTL